MQHLVICWILVVATVSLAASPADARRKRRSKPRATLYFDPATCPQPQAGAVREALERLLGKRKEFRFRPLARILEDRKAARKALAAADRLTARGKEQLGNLEVELGVKLIAAGVKSREHYFHHIYNDPNELDRHAWMLADLAVAHYMAGDEEATRKSLLQAFLLHAKMEFDEKKFPPQMKELLGESRFLADEMGTGDVYVETRPAGAEVRVNGKLIGSSPVMAKGLGTGDNLITVTLVGYETLTRRVPVEGGGESSQVTMDLTPLENSPVPKLQEGLSAAGTGDVSPGLARVSKRRRTPFLFLGRAAGDGDLITLTLYAYDGRKKNLVGKVSGSIAADDPEAECEQLVNTLIGSLRIGAAAAPAQADEPAGEPWYSKFRSSKWFWPAVGIAAGVVVATGATVGIYYGTRGSGRTDHRRTLILLPAGSPGVGF